MLEAAKKLISEYVKRGDKIALAVSGGADSMALTALILSLDFIEKKDITIVNINHKIRGKNSDNDSRFVLDFAKKNNIYFEGVNIDVPARVAVSGHSIEQEARIARREVFYRLVNSGAVKYVLTAHHGADNTESILLHMFRGSGLDGLKGMEVLSQNMIFRPLISTSKEELNEYIRLNNIEFINDETNAQNEYSRNYLRNEILPLIRKRWQNFDAHISALSKEAKLAVEFLDEKAEETNALTLLDSEVKISVSALNGGEALTPRIVIDALKKLGIEADFERKHICAIIDLKEAKNGTEIDLPLGVYVIKQYDNIVLTKKAPKKVSDAMAEFKVGQVCLDGIKIDISESSGGLCFDLNKIPKGALWRFRREGDIFMPFGGGTKKLKEYLIDKKIPKRERNSIPLLCEGKNVLIAGGVEISELVKVEKNSKTMYLKIHMN